MIIPKPIHDIDETSKKLSHILFNSLDEVQFNGGLKWKETKREPSWIAQGYSSKAEKISSSSDYVVWSSENSYFDIQFSQLPNLRSVPSLNSSCLTELLFKLKGEFNSNECLGTPQIRLGISNFEETMLNLEYQSFGDDGDFFNVSEGDLQEGSEGEDIIKCLVNLIASRGEHHFWKNLNDDGLKSNLKQFSNSLAASYGMFKSNPSDYYINLGRNIDYVSK
jgi:hypothetical protein